MKKLSEVSFINVFSMFICNQMDFKNSIVFKIWKILLGFLVPIFFFRHIFSILVLTREKREEREPAKAFEVNYYFLEFSLPEI